MESDCYYGWERLTGFAMSVRSLEFTMWQMRRDMCYYHMCVSCLILNRFIWGNLER